MKTRNKIIAALGVAVLALSMSACSGSSTPTKPDRGSQLAEAEKNFNERTAPDVTGEAEYNNYIRAQEEVYDDPSSVIWCTVYPQSANAPIFTVPIQGKLTSSTVSFFPNERKEWVDGGEYNMEVMVEAQSVDGMYHGSPPPYRYGFTPGGQYVDFMNLPTFCTTALTEFQKQSLLVEFQ